jgi:hypothetical protein
MKGALFSFAYRYMILGIAIGMRSNLTYTTVETGMSGKSERDVID